jgi:hypothetical protein
MYIIEKLLQDYPQHKTDIETFDTFLRRSFKDPTQFAVVEKENYKWVNDAYKAKGSNTDEYLKNMAYYELSFNFDKDFLKQFIGNKNAENMTIDEMRKYLMQDNYDARYETELKEKLGIK